MVTRKVYRAGNSKMLISIPSFLRDKLGLKTCTKVDVTDEDGKIVITPIMEQ